MSTRPDDPRSASSPAADAARPGGGDNLIDLIRQLTQQGTHLAEQQLNLIKAEVRDSAAEVKTAVASMAGAAVLGIAGLAVALMGVAYLVGDAIGNLGLGTLLVGVAALLIAYVMYRAGLKKMDAAHLAPERSRRTLERTPDAARGALNPEQKP